MSPCLIIDFTADPVLKHALESWTLRMQDERAISHGHTCDNRVTRLIQVKEGL